ncbi:CBS domain-containing protein [Actinomadura sp. NEAU-AAG7]|uniref:CBS domain-containing protein n=1 Tax=Actinomadura sp. NEAU-AAG7 TaxID=2839640 RepID=UPI001BE451C2|nr:CBS domain-containing protein [Actinomadura sp. NEAU-AAG7]MBT2212664.1 CBS domain-containing protein [Actinomadura sp. NEAU-AAG7]
MKRLTVEDVMTRDVVTVTEETPFVEIAEAMTRHRISAVPVLDAEGRLVGVVTESDLLRKEESRDDTGRRRLGLWRHTRADAKAGAVDARGLMTSPAVTVTPGTGVAEVARLLNSRGFRAVPVVGPDGRLAGIVARRDLLSVFQRSDADIHDEIVREVLVCRLWQDPAVLRVRVQGGVVHLTGRVDLKSLVPVVVRMTAATEGVVDVVQDLDYDHDDTHPTAYPRA